jgi:hypothetical protein
MSPLIVGAVAGVAVAGALAFFLFRRERQRHASLAAAAAGLGFVAAPDAEAELVERLSGFALFNAAHGPRARHLQEAAVDGMRVSLFEFTAGSGEDAFHRSAVCVRSPRTSLPSFTLQPEGWFDRVAERFGAQDIDFSERQEFSMRDPLRGVDEDAIRGLFTDPVLAAFEGRESISVEAQEETLLVYTSSGRIPVGGVSVFVSRALEVFALLAGGTVPAKEADTTQETASPGVPS